MFFQQGWDAGGRLIQYRPAHTHIPCIPSLDLTAIRVGHLIVTGGQFVWGREDCVYGTDEDCAPPGPVVECWALPLFLFGLPAGSSLCSRSACPGPVLMWHTRLCALFVACVWYVLTRVVKQGRQQSRQGTSGYSNIPRLSGRVGLTDSALVCVRVCVGTLAC